MSTMNFLCKRHVTGDDLFASFPVVTIHNESCNMLDRQSFSGSSKDVALCMRYVININSMGNMQMNKHHILVKKLKEIFTIGLK